MQDTRARRSNRGLCRGETAFIKTAHIQSKFPRGGNRSHYVFLPRSQVCFYLVALFSSHDLFVILIRIFDIALLNQFVLDNGIIDWPVGRAVTLTSLELEA